MDIKGKGRFGIAALTALIGLLTLPLAAEEMDKSPRPPANPQLSVSAANSDAASKAPATAEEVVESAVQLGSSLRPKPRPKQLESQIAALRAAEAAGKAPQGLDLKALSKIEVEPQEVAAAAEPQTKRTKKRRKSAADESMTGSVCGVAAIKGQTIAPITSKVQGCGLADGVRVTSVSGVKLSMAATIDCTTAKALNRWVETALQPAYGGQVVQLKIAGHYTCRPRNNRKGAKVSEHGRGRAIDISGIVLASGKTHMVLRGFDKKMRQAHRGACGIFGTTLGPGSDGYHEDHLHFDTARHRNGAYCR